MVKRQVGAFIDRKATNWWNVIWYGRKWVGATNQLREPDGSEYTARSLFFKTPIHLNFRAESPICLVQLKASNQWCIQAMAKYELQAPPHSKWKKWEVKTSNQGSLMGEQVIPKINVQNYDRTFGIPKIDMLCWSLLWDFSTGESVETESSFKI